MDTKKIIKGDALRGSNKVQLEDELKDVPVIAYYFSAHWCPPCKAFTPKLAEKYKTWNKNQKEIEIVFMSFDHDEEGFDKYFRNMPWLAIPHGDERIDHIATKYRANSIPQLIIVDENEKVLSDKGVQTLTSKGEKALEKWKELYEWEDL